MIEVDRGVDDDDRLGAILFTQARAAELEKIDLHFRVS